MSEILFQNEKYKETEGVTQYQSPSQHVQGPRFDSPTLWRKMLFVVEWSYDLLRQQKQGGHCDFKASLDW